MTIKRIVGLIVAGSVMVLVSCSEESKLNVLLKKKAKLRTELAEIQDQINQLQSKEKKDLILPLVGLAKLTEKKFIHKIKVQGNVETAQDALLNSEFGGLVSKIHVEEGDRVQAGQTLVSLDAEMMTASIKELQTQLDYAEYLLEKQTALKERGVGSEFDLKGAQNQVNSLKSKLASLELQRSKATITAPFSGVIDQIFTKEGQMASPQSMVLRIVNTNEMTVSADISEKHLKKIKVGSTIEVSFPNYKDTTVNLNVASVSKYINPTNRTFRITAKLNNNNVFVPNMLAEVNVIDTDIEKALVIPSVSILKDYNNNDYIFIASKIKNNEYKLKKVFVSELEKFNGESMVEFKGKVNIGSQVVVEGIKGISESDIVRIN
ncbi:MAG: efflux RND transporter periplasmic adaptor subunit [Crocinitomicaceae bacterium]